MPWRRAFDTLLEVNGLAMERHGNVIWVAPLAELAAREKLRFEAHARAADLEPLASRTFVLRYPRAEDVRKLLTGSGSQRVLSKRGSVMADARTNLLFVTDLDARVAQIAELIALIDKPTPQVMIEARIVEGDAGFSRNLGVQAVDDGARAIRRRGSGGRQGRRGLRSVGAADLRFRRRDRRPHVVRRAGDAAAEHRTERARSAKGAGRSCRVRASSRRIG